MKKRFEKYLLTAISFVLLSFAVNLKMPFVYECNRVSMPKQKRQRPWKK